MGLDMYLTKKIYIGANYKHNNVKGKISITKEGKPIKVNLSRVSYIEERVGQWRKANQIHSWFVKNVQNGEDDCGEYHVSKKQLEQLLSECKEVKKKPEMSKKVLPTTSGFFFGSTDYDEWYREDINSTIKIIQSVLKEIKDDDNAEIFYQSSW
jgi:hypothetical protein